MSYNVYKVTIAFKGVKYNIQIIPDEYDCYELLIKFTKPLSIKDRSNLRSYLHQEGYIDEAFKGYRT
jgi:hypothetical protein